MKKKEEIEEVVEKLTLPVLERLGLSLYDVEYVKEGGEAYLRVYIDKEGGVNVGDCETVTRELNPILDERDPIDDAYIFEVSSPGLTRTLRRDRHFEKSLGEPVEVKLFKPLEKRKEWEGILTSYDENTITIEEEDKTRRSFPRSQIARVHITFHE
ncbi:MAG: ribosome maturation factor RimP [Lachnospiraceae bacterium]|nr:ribosome maturation factor RimP [Lachnospiraceae bacterium]MBQ7506509.1 ribosome maturation factor RimP [Lachnospiraceae bacterium]